MVETAGETRVPEAPGEARVLADAAQDRAIGWAPGAGNLVVLGAPGTGKTRVAVELAVRRALAVPRASWSEPTGGVMLLVPDRRRADRLGDTLEIRLAGTGAAVEVRTPVALAFQLVARSLTARGEPDPTLMSGPDVDAALADLLEGHRAGAGARPDWPAAIPPETLELPAFRAELRDLLTRAAELGVGPEDLAEFARDVRRPEWAAAAAVLGEYRDVMELADRSSGRGRRLDHARILAESATLLHYWEQDVGADVPRPAWSLVVVDDYQDATPAVAHLLRVLASGGTQVVLVGDPDTAVQQFRGGRAHLLGEALGTAAPHGFGAEAIRLGTCYRGTPELRDATRAVTALVRPTLAGVAHRAAGLVGAGDAGVDGSARGVGGEGVDGAGFDGADERPGADDGGSDDQIDRAGVELRVLGSTALEGAYVARRLREEHLLGGTPWSGMAVIARASSEVARLRGALRAAGVPTLSDGAGGPLRDEPGVRPLLTALDGALAEHPTADQVRDLLLSPIGALDAVHLRSLVRELRVRAPAEVDVDDALVACVEAGGAGLRRGSRHARGVGRVVAVLAATGQALAAPRAEANGVLWECWDATGLAEVWRARALGGGPGAERADADLTPSSPCSRRPNATGSAAAAAARRASSPGSAPRTSRRTTSRRARAATRPSRCSPSPAPLGGSGTSWRSPACRRTAGRTCACATRCWAPGTWPRWQAG